MRQLSLITLSLIFGLLTSSAAAAPASTAAAPAAPSKVVQQFIDDILKGRFAEARTLTLEQANLSASLFGNWLFNPNAANVATADIFLSRKFSQAFRYSITGTTEVGDNQVRVETMRVSPNLVHLYTWALASKQGAPPYEIIEAVDAYLTKVNFPVEQSRMEFLLIRDTQDWYIGAVRDERFIQFQQLWLARQPHQVMAPPAATTTPPAAAPPAAATAAPAAAPPATATAAPAAAPPATTGSSNAGRQMADRQFNATLQSFNHAYQPPPPPAAAQQPPAQEEDKPSFLSRVVTGIFGKKSKETGPVVQSASLQATFREIRTALADYAVSNGNLFPANNRIYNWKSFRKLISQYSKKPFPATEDEAGFSFVDYRVTPNQGDYVLLLELHKSDDGLKRVELSPYGVERAG